MEVLGLEYDANMNSLEPIWEPAGTEHELCQTEPVRSSQYSAVEDKNLLNLQGKHSTMAAT